MIISRLVRLAKISFREKWNIFGIRRLVFLFLETRRVADGFVRWIVKSIIETENWRAVERERMGESGERGQSIIYGIGERDKWVTRGVPAVVMATDTSFRFTTTPVSRSVSVPPWIIHAYTPIFRHLLNDHRLLYLSRQMLLGKYSLFFIRRMSFSADGIQQQPLDSLQPFHLEIESRRRFSLNGGWNQDGRWKMTTSSATQHSSSSSSYPPLQ